MRNLSAGLQVASVEAVAAEAGLGALQSADAFLRALSAVESGPAFTSPGAVLELPVLWRFAQEVAASLFLTSLFLGRCDSHLTP